MQAPRQKHKKHVQAPWIHEVSMLILLLYAFVDSM